MIAEYPSAILVPADATNYGPANRKWENIEHIVIHETDGRGVAMNVARMWQEQHHGSSAHFVVGQDGVVIQSVLAKDVAYHAHHANRGSIGIEHCARAAGEFSPDDPGLPLSPVQLVASARLVAWLCMRCGLPPTRGVIMGHCEIDNVTTHRKCPIAVFDLDSYVVRVELEFARLQAASVIA